jgi:hypothetical protein
VEARKPPGHERKFLDGYPRNATAYLSGRNASICTKSAPGRWATRRVGPTKRLLRRLLIDPGRQRYSLLATMRVIELGQQGAGKNQLEPQMVLTQGRDRVSGERRARDWLQRSARQSVRCQAAPNALETAYDYVLFIARRHAGSLA